MSLSSFCVVTNALRLNWFDMHDGRKDKKIRSIDLSEEKEEEKMKKTMKIEGMMCGHCEARVKKCLEALSEVEEAVVSHEAGTAVVTLSGEIADEVLKKSGGGSGLQGAGDPVEKGHIFRRQVLH